MSRRVGGDLGEKVPHTDEWMRTFCIITTIANELVGQIHDRMPVILPPDAYDRWLANIEPDPRDLLGPFPSELMKIWPISTRVNKPENDEKPVEIEDDSRLLYASACERC